MGIVVSGVVTLVGGVLLSQVVGFVGGFDCCLVLILWLLLGFVGD